MATSASDGNSNISHFGLSFCWKPKHRTNPAVRDKKEAARDTKCLSLRVHANHKDTSCFTLLTRCVRKWLKFGLYLHLKPLKKSYSHDYNPLWPSENKLPFLFCREQNDKGGSNIIRLYLASQNMTYCILYSLRPNPEELRTKWNDLLCYHRVTNTNSAPDFCSDTV